MWDSNAPVWERQRARVWQASRPVSDWMVDHLELRPGQTVLELAAGPGDTGFLAAERVGPQGRLISSDWSEEMIGIARRRAAEVGVTNVEFKVIDGEKIELPDASADAVLCRWGYMLMLDPKRAMAETRRVLRRSGRVAFAVWGTIESNPWIGRLTRLLVMMGKVPRVDPLGPGGIASLGTRESIRDLVLSAGFGEPEIDEVELHWRYSDFEDYWVSQTDAAGAVAEALASLNASEVSALRSDLEESAAPFKVASGYDFPALSLAAVAS